MSSYTRYFPLWSKDYISWYIFYSLLGKAQPWTGKDHLADFVLGMFSRISMILVLKVWLSETMSSQSPTPTCIYLSTVYEASNANSFDLILYREKRRKEMSWRVRLCFKGFNWSIRYGLSLPMVKRTSSWCGLFGYMLSHGLVLLQMLLMAIKLKTMAWILFESLIFILGNFMQSLCWHILFFF